MTDEQETNHAFARSRSNAGLERCADCRKWHKSKHYDCQHNGPWGGCSAKQETKFEPKKVRANV